MHCSLARSSSRLILALCILGANTTVAQAQPKRAPTTPPVIKISHESERITYRLTIRPGVPAPGTTVSVDISLAEILAVADPTYGNRKPINDGELTVFLVGPPPPAPADGKKKSKAMREPAPWIDVRVATKLPDAGAYGVTFTAPAEGIYGLHVTGATATAGDVDFSTTLTYGIWPLPEGSEPPPVPVSGVPQATDGNLVNGKLVCDKLCQKNLPNALPAGASPDFLASPFAAGHTEEKLLTEIIGDEASRLTTMEKTDLLFYLHTLHVSIQELFPEAAAYMAPVYTINEHGLERLDETAKIKLDEAGATGQVFVVYKGAKDGPMPRLIDFKDRVARDMLKKDDRLGYVVFCELPGESQSKELAIAMGPEPTYPIVGLVGRDAKNHRDPGFAKLLETFAGKGKFNDAGSLRKGSSKLRDKLLPLYLRAAELATMYYADEREFTAFDGAFD